MVRPWHEEQHVKNLLVGQGCGASNVAVEPFVHLFVWGLVTWSHAISLFKEQNIKTCWVMLRPVNAALKLYAPAVTVCHNMQASKDNISKDLCQAVACADFWMSNWDSSLLICRSVPLVYSPALHLSSNRLNPPKRLNQLFFPKQLQLMGFLILAKKQPWLQHDFQVYLPLSPFPSLLLDLVSSWFPGLSPFVSFCLPSTEFCFVVSPLCWILFRHDYQVCLPSTGSCFVMISGFVSSPFVSLLPDLVSSWFPGWSPFVSLLLDLVSSWFLGSSPLLSFEFKAGPPRTSRALLCIGRLLASVGSRRAAPGTWRCCSWHLPHWRWRRPRSTSWTTWTRTFRAGGSWAELNLGPKSQKGYHDLALALLL